MALKAFNDRQLPLKDGEFADAYADLENVVMRVTMGKVRDYFKPVSGKSLCDMLTSQRNHMWSANGGVPTKDGGGGSWLRKNHLKFLWQVQIVLG